ncbi:DNA adenine methylase [Angulomicrobium amanitiforme]|uniref:DNA adenine methylase n=1 Tax=Ancylobacter amanitiformis TaxID=217069 RepID=A0ABU0LQD5_9HYPH|nr:DNA adenine methylase [Ancylobacter amanitiformis]
MLLRKERSYAEVYNDLDDHIVGLFRVLQDDCKAEQLVSRLYLTPFSRREFDLAWEAADNEIEQARRLVIRSFMGFGSNAHNVELGRGATGFRADSTKSGSTPAHDWSRYPASLYSIVERMRGVVIEHRPALQIMTKHDGPNVLHYVDPPYMHETRGLKNKHDPKHLYRYELSAEDHQQLLSVLAELKGMVVLSGYPTELYDEMLRGWSRVETKALADGARARTEVLWINPAAATALRTHRGGSHMPLFAEIRP